MENDEFNADVRSLEGDQTTPEPQQPEVDQNEVGKLVEGVDMEQPVELAEAAPQELIPESPDGAEENDGEPEKPDFGEYPDEASPEHTEDHADFDAGSDDEAASEPPR